MKKTLWRVVAASLMMCGCQDPTEQLDGPGGCRRWPVVHGGTRFADDSLSIPVEALAKSDQTRPRIVEFELYADGQKVPSPQAVIREWQGKYGEGEICDFQAPPGARSLKAVLLVHHLNSIFQMEVPFELDPQGRATNKWLMGKEKTREVGTTVMSGPNPPPFPV